MLVYDSLNILRILLIEITYFKPTRYYYYYFIFEIFSLFCYQFI